ncbi:peptidyl-prolyl cis-trans isomerase [Pontibacillus yanchengensis]|uniref:peptidylprolyl isomerase n=1 Tax=Pontibacillus yanchengensis Y32 TaxID=1385514 RepID=A0A0A2T8I0_9BACI|nr:peptidyl-prolyl cis-trans isomerase [Pontibacillus yanchengensis]KGP71824.1 peptidylprolyl isomerase [Pontibacillus yanchengensis Y32]
MTRKVLWGIIVILLVTNATTLFFELKPNEQVSPSQENQAKPVKEEDEREPVATIDGTEITHQDWLTSLKEQHGEAVLEELINKEIVLQLAEKNDIKIEKKLIERELSLMETMQTITDDKTIQTKREQWEDQITYNYYLDELITRDIKINEDTIKDYYDSYKEQFDFTETYQLSHIVVSSEAEANKITKELKEGASFSVLAREYSNDESTKDKGGYLGYFSKESAYFPSEYYEHAQKLSSDAYSKPFKTNQGYILIKVHRTLPGITFTYDELKNQIKRQLALDYVGDSYSPKVLWEELNVNWMYGD